MKDLFHGTTYDFTEINIRNGKGYKDFGKGFYATAVKSHAENIAKRNKYRLEAREAKIKQRNPNFKVKVYQAYCYNLEFDDSYLENPRELKIKVFKTADKEWMRFILRNRDCEMSAHDFDIVIGPTADENTVTIINAYKEELIAKNYADEVLEALVKELEPENLPKQYFFGTNAAIKTLRFKNFRREIVG